MAGEAIYYGTGRRKNAVARVRIVPGTGKVTVNGRDGLDFFGRQALVDYAKTPFGVTDTVRRYRSLQWRRHVWSGRCSAHGHRSRSSRGWRLSRRTEARRLPHA